MVIRIDWNIFFSILDFKTPSIFYYCSNTEVVHLNLSFIEFMLDGNQFSCHTCWLLIYRWKVIWASLQKNPKNTLTLRIFERFVYWCDCWNKLEPLLYVRCRGATSNCTPVCLLRGVRKRKDSRFNHKIMIEVQDSPPIIIVTRKSMLCKSLGNWLLVQGKDTSFSMHPT